MNISLNWLQRLLPSLERDIETISKTLTALGFEVEGIEKQSDGFEGVIVGKVLECAPHPESDHLSVTKLFDGKEELQVVCGAPNVAAGQTVAFAPVGSELPLADGTKMKMKKVKLRGIDSFGMICGEDEIGLGDDHSGIILFDDHLSAGKPVVEIEGLYDVVFEVNVTPDRPDALCHIGIARELGAALGLELRLPSSPLQEGKRATKELISIDIVPESGCTRYVGRVVEGVRIAPSPDWMRRLLHAVGVRPICNVVDITNFVLLEWGQPLHSFDLDKIKSGKIVVRRAKAGEQLTTLDGQARALAPSDLLICDGEHPACVAGVMGGAESEVDEKTERILLEAAWFQPPVVRRQSKRLGLSSDSSYRFERGIDPLMQRDVSDYASALIAEICGGEVSAEALDIQLPTHPQKQSQLLLRNGQVKRILGIDPDTATVERLLNGIGIATLKREPNGILFELPGWRPDLGREVDLIEEVARLIGYDKIPMHFPSVEIENKPLPKAERVQRRLRRFLAARGLNEALSLRFVSRANLDRLFSEKDPRRDAVRILNPLSEEWALLPTSPIPHLLQTVSTNARNREEAVRYFEVAHLFAPAPEKATDKDPGVVESDRLAMVIAGKWPEGRGNRDVDFFDLKGILEALLWELGVPAEFRRATKQERYAHPYRHAEILIDGVAAGEICEVHPLMREQFEFDAMPAVICDLDYSKIVELALPQEQFTPFSRFGAVTRDLSLIVDHRIDQEEIYQKLLQIPAKNRVALHFVESYCGQGVPEGKRNLLYQSVYQLNDGSLTDDEVNQAQERFVAQVSALPGVEVR